MNQTIAPAQEGLLLAHAMSKLRPGIFLHPVWVRFGKKETPSPLENLQALLQEAEQLQHDNPGDACQVLLICAVQLNYSGQGRPIVRYSVHMMRTESTSSSLNTPARAVISWIWGPSASTGVVIMKDVLSHL